MSTYAITATIQINVTADSAAKAWENAEDRIYRGCLILEQDAGIEVNDYIVRHERDNAFTELDREVAA